VLRLGQRSPFTSSTVSKLRTVSLLPEAITSWGSEVERKALSSTQLLSAILCSRQTRTRLLGHDVTDAKIPIKVAK
jgi:hypothetical protein